MPRRTVVVLTGGPCGGKSTLLEDVSHDPRFDGCFVALPETINVARFVNISPRDKLFQRAVVNMQMALEDALDRTLGEADSRPVLCHRGSLDPLAFWLQRGWSKQEFFEYTGTRAEEHHHRYAAVLHLVTAADGVRSEYTRWPLARRPERAEEALELDHWLRQAWNGHPRYFVVDNEACNWRTKSKMARKILGRVLLS